MEHIIEEQSKSINKLVKANKQMSEYIETLRDENTRLRSQLAEVTAERDAAVEALAKMANGYKDCGGCINIGESIGKCDYMHTGDCYIWHRKGPDNANG